MGDDNTTTGSRRSTGFRLLGVTESEVRPPPSLLFPFFTFSSSGGAHVFSILIRVHPTNTTAFSPQAIELDSGEPVYSKFIPPSTAPNPFLGTPALPLDTLSQFNAPGSSTSTGYSDGEANYAAYRSLNRISKVSPAIS